MKLKGNFFIIYFYLFEIKCLPQTMLQLSQLLPMQLVVQLPALKALLALHQAIAPLVHHVVRLRTPIGFFFQTFGKQYIQTMVIL